MLYSQRFIFLCLFCLLPSVISYSFYRLNTFPRWIVLYFVVFCLLVQLCLFLKKIYLPKLSKPSFFLFFSFLLALVFNLFFHPFSYFSAEGLQRLIFPLLCLYFYNLFLQKKEKLTAFLLTPTYLATLYFLFVAFYTVFTGKALFPHRNLHIWSAGFINPNMAAEFVGFSILLQLYNYQKRLDHKKNTFFHFLLLAFSFVVIYFTLSRSVVIGLSLSLLIFLYTGMSRYPKRLFYLFSFTLMLIISIRVFIPKVTSKARGFLEFSDSKVSLLNKEGSTSARWAMITSSLELLKENPFGVGFTQFAFSLMPLATKTPGHEFTEDWHHNSPHNSFLLWLVEDGVHVFFLFSLFLLSFLFKYRSRFKLLLKGGLPSYFLSLAVFIFVSMLFQFPLLLPVNYVWVALLSGFFLYHFTNKEFIQVKVSSGLRLFSFASCLVFFLTASSFIYSHYHSFRSGHLFLESSLACKLSKANYRGCLNLIEHHFRTKNLKAVEKIIHAGLSGQPKNFFYKYQLARLRNVQGDTQSECVELKDYVDIFAGKSKHQAYYNHHCLNSRRLLSKR